MYLHSDIVEAFQLAKERVLARKSFSERLMTFLYPENLGIEVAHELERMGLKEEVRRYFRAVENYEIEKLRAQKEYLFWREYKMEELKKELAEDLIEVELIKRKFLGFIPTYDISEGEKLIEKYMEKYPVDDILISLKSIEAQTSGDNKKKAKVVRKKVSRSGGGRKKKIAFSILASGLMIGAAATAGWYWYTHKDTDNDGISDYLETHKYHTDPNNPDTDNDGINDYQEIFKYRTDPFNPDTDNDGLLDGNEIFKYHTDPVKPNPAVGYAVRRGLNQALLEDIKILEKDGKLDENEKELIDALVFVQEDLIPENIKIYYPEKKEVTSLMNDFALSCYSKEYLKRNDILFWEKKLFSSVSLDSKISDKEIDAIKKLENEKRWWIVRDIIASGMIED